MLRLLPAYTPSLLVRTRDPAVLSTCHTVVDVGGEYAPSSDRYDHHQRTFSTTFPNHGTKLSSAGLVYLHFGRSIISVRTGLQEDHEDVSLLYEKLYTDFIEALDANDNGIEVYDPKSTSGLNKRFKDHGVTLASLVADLNHPFDESTLPTPVAPVQSSAPTSNSLQEAEDTRFLQASALVGTVFLRKLAKYHEAWLPARAIVQKAYADRNSVDPSGAILLLPKAGIPWKDHLYEFEGGNGKTLFVLYPETEDPSSKWRVQAVSESRDSFESRRPLKEEWRGVRDEDLSQKSGIKGCVFVHASGFIGGNATKEGALEMARKSME